MNDWVEAGVIEFETPTGLHEGYAMYEYIEDLETEVRKLISDGYVINSI
jgi:hypothetical protein